MLHRLQQHPVLPAHRLVQGRSAIREDINLALAAQCDKIHLDSHLSVRWDEVSRSKQYKYKAKLKDLVSMVVYSL